MEYVTILISIDLEQLRKLNINQKLRSIPNESAKVEGNFR